MEEGFSSSRVISRQEGSTHLISLDRKSSPSLCSAQTSPSPCSQDKVHPPQGTVLSSPGLHTALERVGKMTVISLRIFSFSLFLSPEAGDKSSIFILCGKEMCKALLEKDSKWLPEEISANLPHCRLAQWFKQLRVIFLSRWL